MLNLSVLHNKKLFPSAEQPAMIFVAEHCRPKKGDTLVFASAERSETFRKHGIVELFLERLNFLPAERILKEPHLFKIASYGTPRDRSILRQLLDRYDPLEDVLNQWSTKFNRGFQKTASSTPVPPAILGQPMLEAVQLQRFFSIGCRPAPISLSHHGACTRPRDLPCTTLHGTAKSPI